jgi:hypothetical protein
MRDEELGRGFVRLVTASFVLLPPVSLTDELIAGLCRGGISERKATVRSVYGELVPA